jgi:hypothetical protein
VCSCESLGLLVNQRVAWSAWNVLTCWATTSFLRRILLDGVSLVHFLPSLTLSLNVFAAYSGCRLFSFGVCCSQNMKSQCDLCPILFLLTKCVHYDRSIRKFLRQRVLPPLTDVHCRPEEGTTLRNKLCRLLTAPFTQVRSLVEEFLFILCKENGEYGFC